jgi:hypothetical protein
LDEGEEISLGSEVVKGVGEGEKEHETKQEFPLVEKH